MLRTSLFGALAVALALAWLGQARPASATTGDIYRKGTVYVASTHPNHGRPANGWGAAVDLNVGSGSDDYGMPLYAPAAGRVSAHSGSGFGNAIVWTSSDGSERIFLGHLSRIVKTGPVCSGELMGKVGMTGHADGPHVHIDRSVNGRAAGVVLSGKAVLPGKTYRSAGPAPLMITRPSLSPRAISPNGDGLGDRVRIRFRLSETAVVNVVVTRGRTVVRRIGARTMRGGTHSIVWNGTDARGGFVGTGIYQMAVTGRTRCSRATLRASVAARFPPLVTLADSRGRTVTTMPAGDTLTIRVRGLRSRAHYRMQVLAPAGFLENEARLQTDSRGEIRPTALAYDVGLAATPGGTGWTTVGGAYAVSFCDDRGAQIRRYPFEVDSARPVVRSVNSSGDLADSFPVTTSTVWAAGSGMPPGRTITLYVVRHGTGWTQGAPLADAGDGAETVTIGPDGRFLASVWSTPTAIGSYDLVADLDSDGVYDIGEPVDGNAPAGFTVQNPASADHLVAQIACDANGSRKDVFARGEDLFAAADPLTRSGADSGAARTYVVAHRSDLTTGTPLVDVSPGGAEMSVLQRGSARLAPLLVWPRPLAAGVYDIVVDVDGNGLYGPGIDVLDDVDAAGHHVGGFTVAP